MRSYAACITLLLFVCSISTAFALDGKDERESIKGLSAVFVIVEDLAPAIEQAGLTKADILTDVELKLRLAGIPVLNEKQWLATLGGPFLHVNANVFNRDSTAWPFSIDVSLNQRVVLERRSGTIVFASTWSVGDIGSVGSLNVRSLRDYVKDQVDKFINAYLA